MSKLKFVHGDGVSVKINGRAVGGILSAECGAKNNLMKIQEFLTVKPVYFEESPEYTLVIKSRYDLSDLPNGEQLSSVSFEYGGRKITYSGCAVGSTSARMLPGKLTEYSAVLSASDRSVEYV